MNEEQPHTKTTNSLADEIADLQKLLANLDFSSAINSIRETESSVSFLLVCVLENLRIRIDGNKNHQRPHIHIDYGRKYHSASYAIDSGERLAGELSKQYDQQLREWIVGCRPKLMELWHHIQAGQPPEPMILEIRGGQDSTGRASLARLLRKSGQDAHARP